MQQQYNQYDAIAFAEDPSFIRWVRHKEATAKSFWEQWLKEHPDKTATIQEAKVLVQAIQIKEKEPSQARLDNLWGTIETAIAEEGTKAKTSTAPRSSPTKKLRPLRWLGYAAAAAIAALFVFQFYNPTTTISATRGAHIAHYLPDQSKVELNADSKISYKARSWSSERLVELEGEAFFEVAKGATFKVLTSNGTVEVLGTQFNVNARNNTLVVDCKEGKVRVSAKADKKILMAGQGTRLNDSKTALVNTYPSKVDKKIGWRAGNYYLEGVALSQAIAEFERQYNIQFKGITADLLQRNGDYTFGGDLDNALEDLFFQLPVTYTSEGTEVIIQVNE